jgi:acetyl-CoA C-acetyltransferase
MLKEIRLAGGVRTPFGSFCGAFTDVSVVKLGKAAAERFGLRLGDIKEVLLGNILSGALRPEAGARSGSGRGFAGGGMGVAMALELT